MRKLMEEEGVGLIEIVVSMFILGLLAVAFLPFLIQSYSTTRTNTTLATATQLLSKDLDTLRTSYASPTTCANLTAFAGQATTAVVDDRGVSLKVARSLTCTQNTAATVTVTVQVLNTATSAVVAQAKTKVYVSS